MILKWYIVLILTLHQRVHYANCAFGGHDLFTSLSQLEVLWRNEHEIVRKMEDAMGLDENVTKAMQK